jgi:molecular chaperone HtpG
LLQQNPDLDAMRSALTRRVVDMLGKLSKSDTDEYASFWREFGATIKEGVIEDQQNNEKLMQLLRFTTTKSESEAQDQSLADYLSRAAAGQDKIYYLVGDNYENVKSSPHLEQLREKGLEVLLLHDRIDSWVVEHLREFDGKEFQDVGRGQLSLPEGEGEITQDAINDEHEPLLEKIRKALNDKVVTVNVSQRLVDSPACVVTSDQDLGPQLRRMLEASGQALPETKPVLEINIDHPLVTRLSAEIDDAQFGALSHIVLDHALLAEGAQLDNPAEYVRRMNQYLLDVEAGAATE